MKIVFVSNFLNHHQLPFCSAIKERCEDFSFIATENVTNIGYQRAMEEDYVLHYYNYAEKEKAEKAIIEADAVIFGACPNELIEKRMKLDKLSFLFSERFFKEGVSRRFIPSTRKKIRNRIARYKDQNMYILCASAYLPYDLSFFGYPTEKYFKWGYFPQLKIYSNIQKIIEEKKEASLLWAGRLIDWKHSEQALILAKQLIKSNYNFTLNIIGDGPLKRKLEKLIKKFKLQDYVKLLGSVSSDKVREQMEKATIFLFTSNRKEGWGAVLNEAMNSGCAVVASHAIGSVPFLIEDKQNGLIYQDGNSKDLFKKVKWLLDNPEKRKLMGNKAYNSLVFQWNAENAAERLYAIIKSILEEERFIFDDGVCSRAEIIKDNWYR